ncbi:MAG TPA: TIGR02206 family membrane protein, partial [Spirochaetia bacterium]|nr:TIGR02206 family membrane protein [Spirochaetia bacterium]
AAGFTFIVGAQVVFTVVLSTPNGVRIRSPQVSTQVDPDFLVSGDAWMRGGLQRVEVLAAKANDTSLTPLSFIAQRDEVKFRGRALYPLSTWTARESLPGVGTWQIWARAVGQDGTIVETSKRKVTVASGAPSQEFRNWAPEHLIPLVLVFLTAIGLGLVARGGTRSAAGAAPAALRGLTAGSKSPTERFYHVALGVTIAVWVNEFSYQVYWFLVDGWSVSTALMLQMCGLSILFFPVAFFSESQRTRQFLFDILYFWGIGGALQALIAPDIGSNGFPDFRYFSFFVSHGLIITSGIVMAMAGGVRITIRSLIRAAIVTNIIMIPVYGIDMLIQLIPPYDPGNYFVLGFPPPTGSIVDLFSDIFGPSPRYVVGLEAMGVAVFLILYAPWPIARALQGRSLRRRTRPVA